MTIDLLDFQVEDVAKLKAKRSCLIGNDAGTGKTYEGIALDQARRIGDGHPKVIVPRKAKTLVIAPKSVLSVWDEHCMKLTNEDVYVYDDTGIQPKKARENFLKDVLNPNNTGYFIMHWEGLRNMPELKRVYWFHIIADECHRASGRKTQQTIALKKLKAEYKTGMSGTPATNRMQDLWSILNWLWPNFYTSYWKFVNAYAKVVTIDEKTGEELGYRRIDGVNPETIGVLHKQMEPWFVRRRKEDVLKDLPPKYYSRIWVDLETKQRKAYDQMRKTMVAWVGEHEDEIEAGNPLIAKAVVAQLVRLQQFSDGYMVPLLDDDGNQIIKTRWKIDADTGEREPVDVPQWKMIEPSAKLDTLMELLEDRDDSEQFVVFSQFVQPINLLASRLEKRDIAFGLLTGAVGQQDRAQHIEDFQSGKSRVFLGTIAAGGVGITLTASSTVIFIDRAWSPALNSQAEDRLHRIGQDEAVEVIDLAARNTVDLGKFQQLVLKAKNLALLLGDKVDEELVIKEMQGVREPELADLLAESVGEEGTGIVSDTEVDEGSQD